MTKILDLEMSDEEYLELVKQGRNPVLEKRLSRDLVKLGVSPQEAARLVNLPLVKFIWFYLNCPVAFSRRHRYIARIRSYKQ